MNQQSSKIVLSPKRIQEKADILETNLFKSLAKQTDPAKALLKIDRKTHPNTVVIKAISQLLPRFTIIPEEFIQKLEIFLQKDIPLDKQEEFEGSIPTIDKDLHGSLTNATRSFTTIISNKNITITINGIPLTKSQNGKIEESFFELQQSPGKLLKNGFINFKEINKYPIVKIGAKLLYITNEKQGQPGLTFDGNVIAVEEAQPLIINIGSEVEKIDDKDNCGTLKGYFLQSKKNGVILLERDEQGQINGIEVTDKVEVKKLDYFTGNVGTQYSCPIHMKIGVVCNNFKIRVKGNVEVNILDGGEISTNNEAIIMKIQPGSSVMALKDITTNSVSNSKIISEKGIIRINNELLDSQISSQEVIFKNNKGLITNNKIESEKITLSGLHFASENNIYFGHNLFMEKKNLLSSQENIESNKQKLQHAHQTQMKNLQLELKKMAKLTLTNSDLAKHFKLLVFATKALNYEIIFEEMDFIQKINNTKIVANVRKQFQKLDKIAQKTKTLVENESSFDEKMNEINQRVSSMKLSIEGFLRKAATIKIFCGIQNSKKKFIPDFVFESDGTSNKIIKVRATYSDLNGFEFTK